MEHGVARMKRKYVTEAVTWRSSIKKVFLNISQNLQKNVPVPVFANFLIKLQIDACNVIEKETLAKVFSCEF